MLTLPYTDEQLVTAYGELQRLAGLGKLDLDHRGTEGLVTLKTPLGPVSVSYKEGTKDGTITQVNITVVKSPMLLGLAAAEGMAQEYLVSLGTKRA